MSRGLVCHNHHGQHRKKLALFPKHTTLNQIAIRRPTLSTKALKKYGSGYLPSILHMNLLLLKRRGERACTTPQHLRQPERQGFKSPADSFITRMLWIKFPSQTTHCPMQQGYTVDMGKKARRRSLFMVTQEKGHCALLQPPCTFLFL